METAEDIARSNIDTHIEILLLLPRSRRWSKMTRVSEESIPPCWVFRLEVHAAQGSPVLWSRRRDDLSLISTYEHCSVTSREGMRVRGLHPIVE